MLTNVLKSNSINLRARWPRNGSRGLGIDIGQIHTKIVFAERSSGEGFDYRAATIPTRIRSLPPQNTAEAPTIVETSEPALGSSQSAAATTARPERRLTEKPVANAPTALQWSTREIKSLTSRIAQLIGPAQDVRHHHVNVSLSMSACDYRTIYAPKNVKVNAAGLQKSIATVIGDNRARCVAVLPGQDHPSDDKQTKIRCLSLPEDLAWSIATELDQVGCSPRNLTGVPWCIANALEMLPQVPNTNDFQIGLDWGFESPTLVFVKNREINYVRCLSHGGVKQLASQAVADYQMSNAEASRWVAHSLHAPEDAVAGDAISGTRDWVRECCRNLAKEIDTALDFMRWRNQGLKFEQISLMGGATLIPGLVDFLRTQLQIEVHCWKLPQRDSELTADYALASSLACMALQYKGMQHSELQHA